MNKMSVRERYDSGKLELRGRGVVLRPVVGSDASEAYEGWLADPLVSRYLEARFTRWTVDGIRGYIESQRADGRVWFFAICTEGDMRMVGTVKLGPVSVEHGTGVVGVMVGERSMQGKGIGSESLGLVTRFGFDVLGLRKLFAGIYGPNQASVGAFRRAGWEEEAVLVGQWTLDGEPVDEIRMAAFA